jgi:hypothetical protein
MTDLEANANMNNRKRKQKTHNQPQKSSKLHRSEHAQKPQEQSSIDFMHPRQTH